MDQPHILVVEDDPDFGPLMRMLLGRMGYRVSLAPSGATAMAQANQHEFDVITLDINIPDIDGVDLLEHFRATVPNTPVIMATAQAGSERVIRCLRIGAFDFLKKPFDPALLKPTIERALDRRRQRQTAVLYRSSQAISANREPASLPKALTTYALEAFTCDWCGVMTEAEGVVIAAARGEGLRERVNARLLPRLLNLIDLVQATGSGLAEDGHIAAHGLRNAGSFYGVMVLWRERNRPAYRQPDLEPIGVYAVQTALALENARLMTRMRERVEALERVRARMASAGHLESAGRLSISLARRLQSPLSVGRVYLREAIDRAGEGEQTQALRRVLDSMDAVERIARDIEGLGRTRQNVETDLRRMLETAATLAFDNHALNLDEVATITVPGQTGDLIQMFVHLLDNAGRALQRAGKPLQGNLRVSAEFTDGRARVQIEDQGVGMREEIARRWGEPFFSTWGSTGLGISMCTSILQRHEGQLQLSSTPNQGTRVTVELPALLQSDDLAMEELDTYVVEDDEEEDEEDEITADDEPESDEPPTEGPDEDDPTDPGR